MSLPPHPTHFSWLSPPTEDELSAIQKEVGTRADRILTHFLQFQHPEISRSRVQSLFRSGNIHCEGTVEYSPTREVKAGQKWDIYFPEIKPSVLIPVEHPLEILFEDEHLAIVNKPPGLATHPAPSISEPTLVEVLLAKLSSLSQIGGVERPGIVHRLDQWTSGLLAISKTDLCHQGLQALFAKHDIERRYWALVYGRLPQSKVTLKTLLGRHPKDRVKMTTEVESGKEAITHFQERKVALQKEIPLASWVEATLETGRTHQVRVHLQKLGCSVLGDPLYGVPSHHSPKWVILPDAVKSMVNQLPGQMLHARVLGFVHPITKKALRFEVEPPALFRSLQELLFP